MWTEKAIFFKKPKHKVENKSFQNFTTYWQQQNWAIILQNLVVTFFRISTPLDFFQLLGKVPVCKQFLKIIDRDFTIEESHTFNNLSDISL